jgi:hypothetical protein
MHSDKRWDDHRGGHVGYREWKGNQQKKWKGKVNYWGRPEDKLAAWI